MYRFTRNLSFLEINGVRYVYKRDRDEFEEDDTETIFNGSSDSVIFVGEMNTSSDNDKKKMKMPRELVLYVMVSNFVSR